LSFVTQIEASDRARPPAWRRRKASRHPEILEAARSVFEQIGYERASVGQIAALAGVSEATVYKYFQTKQNLLHQVIHAWMAPPVEELEQGLFRPAGAAERLRLMAIQHLAAMAQSPGLHRLVYRELRWDAEQDSAFHRLNQRYAGLVERIVVEAIAAGEIRADSDPKLVRDLFFGGLEHAGWRMVAAGRKLDTVAIAERLAAQVFRGVASAPAGASEDMAGIVTRMTELVARLEGAAAPGKG
jgi:TetR/AcrR family fatty acid metabolism transcriptional regulator